MSIDTLCEACRRRRTLRLLREAEHALAHLSPSRVLERAGLEWFIAQLRRELEAPAPRRR